MGNESFIKKNSSGFPTQTYISSKAQNKWFQALKENSSQHRLINTEKLSFKIENKIQA